MAFSVQSHKYIRMYVLPLGRPPKGQDAKFSDVLSQPTGSGKLGSEGMYSAVHGVCSLIHTYVRMYVVIHIT